MPYTADQLPSRPEDAAYLAKLGLVPRDMIEQYDQVNGTQLAATYGQEATNQAQGQQSDTSGLSAGGDGTRRPTEGWADSQGRTSNNDGYTGLDANGNPLTADAVRQGQPSNTAGMSAGGADPFSGDLANLPQSARTNMGSMPGLVNGAFSDGTISQYGGNTDYFANKISNLFGGIAPPQAAQMDLSQIPQGVAQQAGSFDALQQLLSGQGFDPKTLAAMNAGVTDNASAAGRSARGSANLAAEQSGLAGSPAALAMRGMVDRNQGAAEQQGHNQVQIANAQQGMANMTAGAGMENQRQLTNAQQANMMALQNMQMIVQGMNTNVANSQQANMAQYQGQQNSAEAQSGFLSSQGQNLNQAMLNKQTNADNTNANNQNAWAINQGGMDQQNNQYNTGVLAGIHKDALDALVQLSGNSGNQGVDYSNLGNQDTANQTPNGSVLGTALNNAGNATLANQVTR